MLLEEGLDNMAKRLRLREAETDGAGKMAQSNKGAGRQGLELLFVLDAATPPHYVRRGWAPFTDRGTTILRRIRRSGVGRDSRLARQ